MVRFVIRGKSKLQNAKDLYGYVRQDGKLDPDILNAAKFENLDDLTIFMQIYDVDVSDYKIDEVTFAVTTETMDDLCNRPKKASNMRALFH